MSHRSSLSVAPGRGAAPLPSPGPRLGQLRAAAGIPAGSRCSSQSPGRTPPVLLFHSTAGEQGCRDAHQHNTRASPQLGDPAAMAQGPGASRLRWRAGLGYWDGWEGERFLPGWHRQVGACWMSSTLPSCPLWHLTAHSSAGLWGHPHTHPLLEHRKRPAVTDLVLGSTASCSPHHWGVNPISQALATQPRASLASVLLKPPPERPWRARSEHPKLDPLWEQAAPRLFMTEAMGKEDAAGPDTANPSLLTHPGENLSLHSCTAPLGTTTSPSHTCKPSPGCEQCSIPAQQVRPSGNPGLPGAAASG